MTYSSPTSAFLFGKEKLQAGEDTKTYERQTDETLPDVSTEDVEKRQEGGFADTKDTKPEETPAASEAPTETPAATETPAPAETDNAGTGAQPETPAKEEAQNELLRGTADGPEPPQLYRTWDFHGRDV